ncbi:MFS transporter [Paenarthrobacter sp. AT5]|uniref:MFS transporter n=1 Tax=Paenarthrobacter TaxID=1742992 RepID=UPI001A988A1D|nr:MULTISPECIES: MFS transporter [Paenarthrobacter]QSZ53940.1 hypothetical protein AYX19_13700 [Paenarthrobacter ureafaciens]WOC62724.1 MFS transporter [Paenarthrobacter sp. AT5]
MSFKDESRVEQTMAGKIDESPALKRVTRKILFRLAPFVAMLYFFSMLDRAAIAYAAPNGMNTDLGLTATQFGLASSLFFLGYIPFSIPISLALRRFGARRGLAMILVAWGAVQALTALTFDATSLNVLRVLLGVTEAAFVPLVLAYLTAWLPSKPRARAFSIFFIAASLATVIGGPLLVFILQWGQSLHADMAGWRFMFLFSGVVPMAIGIIVPFYLKDHPDRASWLSAVERETLSRAVNNELAAVDAGSRRATDAFRSGRAWALTAGYMAPMFAVYILTFFLPTMISSFSPNATPLEVSLLASIPFIFAIIGILTLGRSISRFGHPGLHMLIALTIGAAGALLAFANTGPLVNMIGLSIAALGCLSVPPAAFSIPTRIFAGGAAVAVISMMTSISSIGGLLGPVVTGFFADLTGSALNVFAVVAALLVLCGVIFYTVDRRSERELDRAAETREPAVLEGH